MKGHKLSMFIPSFLLLFASAVIAQVPQSKHVWLVTEENHSYEAVIGNQSMPYFNSLANKYGLATQYYSNRHSSLSALMWLVAGQQVTLNNNTTSCYNVNNIVRQLLKQGMTWKSYQVDLPYAGYQGLSWLNYLRRHNPLIDFSDACTSAQKLNSVPFSQLAADMANNATPNFVYITPNTAEDAHNGTLAQADYWLSQHIPAILARPEFKPGADGLLFVLWDEGNLSPDDNRCSSQIPQGCGGRIATLVIGPQVRPAYRSNVLYAHENLLRTVCGAMGLTSCPGAAALALPMTDFFDTVNVSSPLPYATVYSPAHVRATTSNASPVYAMQVYVDNALTYHVTGNKVNTWLPLSTGQHYIVVQSWDQAGGIHKRGVNVTVQWQSVVIDAPTPNAISAPTVPVVATGGGASPVKSMEVYVDGTLKYQVSGASVNNNFTMAAGQHKVTVKAVDQNGSVTSSNVKLKVQGPSITIASPVANSSLYSPVTLLASAQGPTPVRSVSLMANDSLLYQVSGTGISAPIAIGPGQQTLTIRAIDVLGHMFSRQLGIYIKPVIVTLSAPAANATVKSPVAFKASVPSAAPVDAMQIYVDNVCQYTVSAKSISTSLSMNSGKHYIVMKAWDTGGSTWTTGFNINVY